MVLFFRKEHSSFWQRDRAIVAGCAALLTCLVLAAHALTFPRFAGVFSGKDQGYYLQAARAWSVLDLSPAQHHYLPGYPLVAAPFVWLTPWQPFLLPDLACLLASLLIFVRIGRRLAPGWSDAAPALCFAVAVLSGKWLFFWLWVVPWTSTGSAPLQFGAVLLALRLGERVAPSRAFWLGLCVAAIGAFRPSDAGVLAVTCGLYAMFALVRGRTPPRACAAIVAAGVLGVLAGAVPWMAAHAAIFGGLGPYMRKVAAVGFEWRLLPLRWVLLVIDPRPLLPTGNGIAEVLPWVIPGIAGMILSLLPFARRPIAPAWLAAATVSLHWCLYLTYRDLNSEGLWHFALVHYFKWTFPFLVLWAAQFAAALFVDRRERGRAIFTAALALALFAWRPMLRHPRPVEIAQLRDPSGAVSLRLPAWPAGVDHALFLDLTGSWKALHDGQFLLHIGDATWLSEVGFKVLPLPAGALILPLRPLPSGAALLDLPAGVGVLAATGGAIAAQAVVFGVPCGVLRFRMVCQKAVLF